MCMEAVTPSPPSSNNGVAAATTATATTTPSSSPPSSSADLVEYILYLPAMCCFTEVPMVQRALRSLRHRIDIARRQVSIRHHPPMSPLSTIQVQLQASGFGSEIVQNGELRGSGAWVESLFAIPRGLLVGLEEEDGATSASAVAPSSLVPSYFGDLVQNVMLQASDTTATTSTNSFRVLSIRQNETLISVQDILAALRCTQFHFYLPSSSFPTRPTGAARTSCHPRDFGLSHQPLFPFAKSYQRPIYVYPLQFSPNSGTIEPRAKMDSNTLMLLAALGSILLGDRTEAACVVVVVAWGAAAERRASQLAAAALHRLAPPVCSNGR